jgi:hypothetical protein
MRPSPFALPFAQQNDAREFHFCAFLRDLPREGVCVSGPLGSAIVFFGLVSMKPASRVFRAEPKQKDQIDEERKNP